MRDAYMAQKERSQKNLRAAPLRETMKRHDKPEAHIGWVTVRIISSSSEDSSARRTK